MATFLSDIGDSKDLRELVSRTDIDNTTISVVLDQLRTLDVRNKHSRPEELTVRCRDIDTQAVVVLHLPFKEGARASAWIIYTQAAESDGA